MTTEKLNQVHLIKVTEQGGITTYTVNQEDVLSHLNDFIFDKKNKGYLKEYPFVLVSNTNWDHHFAHGKKYFMIVDEDGMVNNNKMSKLDFDEWDMKANFLYKHNGQPVHKEDLRFNGIYGYGEFSSMIHF
jgi:hypothetical protein